MQARPRSTRQPRASRPARARIAAVALSAAVVLGGCGGKGGGISGPERDEIATVMPGMCKMQVAVQAGLASQAFNIFWDDVHTAAHVLAARLDKANPTEGQSFRVAKGLIENDLATLNIVALQQHVPPFIVAVGAGLTTLKLTGLPTSCAG